MVERTRLRSRQENGPETGFQPEARETRIQAKVWSQTGPDSQERKSERKNISEEDRRFQRQEVMPKAGFVLLFLLFPFLL